MFGIKDLGSLREMTKQYVEAVGDIVAPVLDDNEDSEGDRQNEETQSTNQQVNNKRISDVVVISL